MVRDQFGPGVFSVYDPLMTTILIQAEMALAWLAKELDFETNAAQRAERMKQALLQRLWSEKLGRFNFYDIPSQTLLRPDVLSAYIPLILDLPEPYTKRLLDTLLSRYWTSYPLPTVAPENKDYDATCYWRGPTWINLNWFLIPIVGDKLRDATLALIEEQGFWEYFHPDTGAGLGTNNFTWSAALALDLYHQ